MTADPALPGTMSSSRDRFRSTKPVTNVVRRLRRWDAFRNDVSSTPNDDTPAVRAGSSIIGSPWSVTAFIADCQPTPYSPASWATGRPSLPTCLHTSARARSVIPCRGRATSSRRSVHVAVGHNGSRQRQIRLDHTSRHGLPPIARSRSCTVRRSCAVATTPQPRQPGRRPTVSTARHTSPSTSVASRSAKPSKPSTTVPSVVSSPILRSPRFAVLDNRDHRETSGLHSPGVPDLVSTLSREGPIWS